MSDAQWHYMQNGAQRAPVSRAALEQLAAQGRLQPGDLVWSDGMPQWVAAGNIPGIFKAGMAPPPLAPPGFPAPTAPIGYYGAPPPGYGPQQDMGQDAGIRMLLPVGRSGWAIAAGYLGLISVLVVPAPFAVLFAILAFRDMKKHPEKHGMGRAVFGLIMGILGTGVLLLGLVTALVSYSKR